MRERGMRVRKTLEFIKIGFKQRLVYRSSTIWGFIAAALALFLQIMLWKTLLESNLKNDGRELSDFVMYLCITAFIGTLTNCSITETIAALVRDGSIASSFTRPTSFKNQILSVQIGDNLHRLLFTQVFPIALVFAIYGVKLPGLANGLYFFASALLGAVIAFELQYTTGLLAFFLTQTWYVRFYYNGFMTVFGASAIPLWYYPEWLASISYFLPFRYISYEPVCIFLQTTAAPWQVLLFQLAWIAVVWLIQTMMWHAAQRKLVVQGG